MKTRKAGDRVMIEHIGMATITSIVPKLYEGQPTMYRVKFDIAPPVEYNMGSLNGLAIEDNIKQA